MGDEPGPDPALRDELHRKVGRNLLAYQALENTLKRLLVVAVVAEGTVDAIEARQATRIEWAMGLTMGTVAKAVFEEVLTSTPKPRPEPGPSSQAWVQIRFSIGPGVATPNAWDELGRRCERVVGARNDLVHHLLRKLPRTAAPDLERLGADLDAQHADCDELRAEFEELLAAHEASRKRLAALLASPTAQVELDLQMACGSVVAFLRELAMSAGREEGWVFVTTALARLGSDALPWTEVSLLKEHWGKGWWRKLFEQSQSEFELREEAMPNAANAGQRRWLYRIRPASLSV